MSTYIDIEIIQTLPFANANRDDLGQPKTALFGGTVRGRLSSQSLKRAARFYGPDNNVFYNFKNDKEGNLQYRTKYIKQLLTAEIEARNVEITDILRERIDSLLYKGGPLGNESSKNKALSETLLFLTEEEIKQIADLLLEYVNKDSKSKPSSEEITEILLKSDKKDVALWGRFFASNPAATLEGSAQVASALTTHPVTIEEDFFAAVDDALSLFESNSGSGHVDSAYYNTGTFYKYFNINVEETIATLMHAKVENKVLTYDEIPEEKIQELTKEIIATAITSFSLSNPSGKVRSTGHQTLPSLVRVTIREDRPVNGIIAYEEAIPNNNTVTNIAKASIQKLADEQQNINKFVKQPVFSQYVTVDNDEYPNLGEQVNTLSELIDHVTEAVSNSVHKFYTQLEA